MISGAIPSGATPPGGMPPRGPGGAGHPEYTVENETTPKGGIVLTGSSLMEHFPVDDIKEENKDDYVIFNHRYGGYVMTQLMEVMGTAVFDLVPSALFINIGTNDIDRISEEYTFKDMMENYKMILNSVQELMYLDPDAVLSGSES